MTAFSHNTRKKNTVLSALEFARERFMQGQVFDYDDLARHLADEGFIDPRDVRWDAFVRELFNQICRASDLYNVRGKFMSLEAYMALLDYEELQFVREEAERAREQAQVANYNMQEAMRLTKDALFWTRLTAIAALAMGAMVLLVLLLGR